MKKISIEIWALISFATVFWICAFITGSFIGSVVLGLLVWLIVGWNSDY